MIPYSALEATTWSIIAMKFIEAQEVRLDTLDSDSFEFVDRLSNFVVSAYSVGHVYNDLCGTIWFMYLLYFLIDIVQVPTSVAT